MTTLLLNKGAVQPPKNGWTLDAFAINSCGYSEDISQADWTKLNVSVTGTDMITDDATSGLHVIIEGGARPNSDGPYWRFAEVKQGTARYVVLSPVASAASSAYTLIYDFDTNAWTEEGNTTYVKDLSIEDKGDGWIRLGYLEVQATGSYDNHVVGISSGPNFADRSYSGSGDTLYIRKLQATPLYASSTAYIQTQQIANPSFPTEGRVRTEGPVGTFESQKFTVENLATDANDLTGLAWGEINVTPGKNLLTADAGTHKAFTSDTIATGVAVGDVYSFTVKALPGTHDYLWIGDRGNLPLLSATIDLSDGSIVGSESGVDVEVTKGRDGRWLVKLDITRSWAGTVSLNIGFGGASHSVDAPSAAYAGTETLQIWDMQVEEGASQRTADAGFVLTSNATRTLTFGGNVIYVNKGAVQDTKLDTGFDVAGATAWDEYGELQRQIDARKRNQRNQLLQLVALTMGTIDNDRRG